MLKSCFYSDISPAWAENVIKRQEPNSYLVRQCDRDPSLLILSFSLVNGELKHIIIPDFGTEGFSRKLIKDRLEDTSHEVEKLLASFGCQNPVIPDIPVSPVPQWKKRSSEVTGGPGRCSVCPAVGDPKKIVNHLHNHKVKLCQLCDKYVMYNYFPKHSKMCSNSPRKTLKCGECDFSTVHDWNLTRHVREIHNPNSQIFVCGVEDCGKKFKREENLEKHMKRHQPKQRKEKKKTVTEPEKEKSVELCKTCGETFGSKSAKYRHNIKVHINPTVKCSTGYFKLDGTSLGEKYKQRGRQLKYCDQCSYSTYHKGNLQHHKRSHEKLKRPDFYTCVSTCRRKNGKVYYHKRKDKVRAHMKSCRFYKLTQSSIPKSMIMADSVCFLTSKVDISNNKMKTIIRWVSEMLGQDLVDYNIPQALSKNLNSCKDFYFSKELEFTDKKGNKRTTSFVCMKSLASVVDEIIQRRNISNALAAVSMDGGKDKEVASLAVFDLDNTDPLTDCGLSAGGRRAMYLVAAAQGVPERKDIIHYFHTEMKIWEIKCRLILVGDNAIINKIFGKFMLFSLSIFKSQTIYFSKGLQSHTSHHPLVYSEAARYQGARKTTVGTEWRGDEIRRTANIIAVKSDAFEASGKPRSRLHEYGNCETIPERLPPGYADKELIEVAPPEVLHTITLGPPNDVMEYMFMVDKNFMSAFYISSNISEKSTMYAGKLVGRDVKKVWDEKNLPKLLNFPDGNGQIIVDFLRSLREVQVVAVKKVLPPKPVRDQVISVYRAALKAVVDAKVITETPKAHMINVEIPYYWDNFGSLYYALGEAMEHTHSKFSQSEVAHGTKVRINDGSAKHQDALLRGLTYLTSQNMNLLPKLPSIEVEVVPEGTFQCLAELEESEDTVESLRRQLTVSRHETSQAREEAAMVREELVMTREAAAGASQEIAVRDKIIEVSSFFIFIKSFVSNISFLKEKDKELETLKQQMLLMNSRGDINSNFSDF